MLSPPLMIASDQALRETIAQLAARNYFSIDTEFVRTDTFYPNLGLIQLSDGEQCWLLDPLEKPDFAPLIDLLENPQVTKIFHSCSEDLEVLNHCLGCNPRGIFDTQIAAAFTGHGFSRGYAALIGEVLNVGLNKHETRSDWLRRPLTASQLQYAAEDVYYLLHLYQVLDRQLAELGRQAWMAEEMHSLESNAAAEISSLDYYQKVRGAWKLNRRALAALRLLCDWREREARERNRPRRRIIDDKSLLEIAMAAPQSVNQMAATTAISAGARRRYGELLYSLVAQARELSEDALPAPLPKPVPKAAGGLLKQLRQLVAERAQQLAVPAELLARRADLEQALRSQLGQGAFPQKLRQGWRYSTVGAAIEALLNDSR